MTCQTTRAAIAAAAAGALPAEALAHVAGCDDCAASFVEWTLRQAPPVAIPPTLAVDVARCARLEPDATRSRSNGLTFGVAAAALFLAAAGIAWRLSPGGPSALLPEALFLLACGEAIVLAAWSFAHHGLGPPAGEGS
jgi:hypothetical protein